MRTIIGEWVVRDSQNRSHTLKRYVDRTTIRDGGEAQDIDGVPWYETSGRTVEWLAKGKYRVMDTGEILTSLAPNAP